MICLGVYEGGIVVIYGVAALRAFDPFRVFDDGVQPFGAADEFGFHPKVEGFLGVAERLVFGLSIRGNVVFRHRSHEPLGFLADADGECS